MNISDIKLLFDYNDWANERILGKAAELDPKQLHETTNFPWKSLQGTLVHTLDSENMWRILCQTNQVISPSLAETETFPTLESLVTCWNTEATEMRAYLNSLQDSDMTKVVIYEIPEGKRERVLWHCLWHVVNHGMQHRSEAAAILTNFGHSPGGLDFTRYLNIRAGVERL